jgi:hypothetical protein
MGCTLRGMSKSEPNAEVRSDSRSSGVPSRRYGASPIASLAYRLRPLFFPRLFRRGKCCVHYLLVIASRVYWSSHHPDREYIERRWMDGGWTEADG